MWTTDWHLARDYTPGDHEDIWFLKNEDVDICSTDEDLLLHSKGLLVGVFEKDTESILLSDNTRVVIEDVYQWKSITDIELMNYPKDGSTIAVLLRDFPCYSLGMYTCRYINPDSGERVKAVMLDPNYNFDPNHEESLVLDWNYAYKYSYVPEIKILRGIPQGDFLKKEAKTLDDSLCSAETSIEISEKPLTSSSGSAIIRSKKEGESMSESRIKESGVKWKAIPPTDNSKEGSHWLTYVAEGYPTITNYQRSTSGVDRNWCPDYRKYAVHIKGIFSDRHFDTLRAAKAYAEAHPVSDSSKEEEKKFS